MAIPTLGGLIWHPLWNAPGEGPYSIVAKLIHANALPASYFKEVIRWKGPAGASLLRPKPLPSLNERAASLARLIQDSSLSRFSWNIHSALAGDQTLRYCRTCMSSGFQAAIAQIDGFDDCPIHKEPHLSICDRCGATTPPYYLGNNDRLPKFSCMKCGLPFGGGVLIERRLDAWRPPDHLHRLDFIHQWLREINDEQRILWPGALGWNTTRFLEDGEDQHRRRAVFAALRTLVPNSKIPSPKSAPGLDIFGPFSVDISFERPLQYLSVPAYDIARQLPRGCELDDYRRNLRMPSFGVPVPDDPTVPPLVHAKLIFRAQFELLSDVLEERRFSTVFSSNEIMELLSAQRSISFKMLEDKTFVRAVLAATRMAAEKIANEWHRLLLGINRTDTTRFNESWLTACNRWSGRLGCWREHGYFPIGLIIARHSISWERGIYLAVA